MNKQKKFNTADTLLVITSFPNPENGKHGTRNLNAVGWHSERLLKQIGKLRQILVVAETMPVGGQKTQGKQEFKVGKNILVERVWKKGSVLSFIKMAKQIHTFNKISSILIQFEFNVFGGTLPNLYLLALMLYARLLGKRITFECHQVILDIKLLEKHIGITNPFLQAFYNISLRIYYFLIGILATQIIVFEVELKSRLEKYISSDKMYVLSLSVGKNPIIKKTLARRLANKHLVFKKHTIKRDEFVILLFGFINGYKGIDWVIKQMKNTTNKKLRLLVVGGKNPYLAEKNSYQKFYESIISKLKKYKNTSYVDFVPEHDIPIYYNAADLAVIPYEVFMSASGPFSHALSYNKPILISERLESYTKSHDFAFAMNESHISPHEFIFRFTKRDFLRVVNNLQKDQEAYKKLATFSDKLATLRSIQKIAERMDDIMFSNLYVAREQKLVPIIQKIPAFK